MYLKLFSISYLVLRASGQRPVNWLCFIQPQKAQNSHIILFSKSLRSFRLRRNWLCFSFFFLATEHIEAPEYIFLNLKIVIFDIVSDLEFSISNFLFSPYLIILNIRYTLYVPSASPWEPTGPKGTARYYYYTTVPPFRWRNLRKFMKNFRC